MRMAVVGIGNILLSDEGMGVRAVDELQRRYDFSPAIEIIDGGTQGLNLVSILSGCDRLLIADAVAGGDPPGTLHVFRPQELVEYHTPLSLHATGMQAVLHLLSSVARPPEEVVCIGLEPATLEWGTMLSPVVEGNLMRMVEAILKQLNVWDVQTVLKVKPL